MFNKDITSSVSVGEDDLGRTQSSKARVDVFLELSCFFNDPTNIGNLISGSSVFFKSTLNIWRFNGHILLKPDLENFEHYFASM